MSAERTPSEAPVQFDIRVPYVKEGQIVNHCADGQLLTIASKVYASGGENRMHIHPEEEHSFIVLEGEATFHVGTEEDVRVLGPYEGIFLPRLTPYRFHSSSDHCLVMLRCGSPGGKKAGYYTDGSPKSREAEPIVAMAPVFTGEWFGGKPKVASSGANA